MTRRLSRVTRVRPHAAIANAADADAPRIALQPIIATSTGSVLAVEALARFADRANTEAVLRTAQEQGRGPEVEARCLEAALECRLDLPPGVMLSVNVSPNALAHIAVCDIWPEDLRGVIVEITEQEVNDPVDLGAHLDRLRARGAAIAIDDVSTGYAGLLRLAQMAPDYVKIDRQVVTGVSQNAIQAAVLEALVTLSHRLGAAVIGEGVEDFADLAALADYDVDYAQGFAIARPSAYSAMTGVSAEVVAACRANRRRMLGGGGTSGRDVARTRDVYAVTAALAAADRHRDVHAAISATAVDLGVDMIGVSIAGSDRNLREIANTHELDPRTYLLNDYPATLSLMRGGGAVEVQLDDPGADLAERELMAELGCASLLMVPLVDGGTTIGIVEFAQFAPRRWSSHDIAHAIGLAEHLTPVLRRLGVGIAPVATASAF
jgi:EAL domain-containing protein (putative c-di-GMP-specific phosphodiesterase class I)